MKTRTLLAALGLLACAALLVRLRGPSQPRDSITSDNKNATAAADPFVKDGTPNAGTPTPRSGRARPFRSAGKSQPTVLQRLLAQDPEVTRVTPEQIETHLALNKTNATSLLAAWQGGGGQEYLRKAAALYPNDPRVQMSVTTLELFPAEQRQWLERFKESAPDNALANYLSAREHFQSGHPQKALQELAEASNQARFDDYRADRLQDLEELHLLSGKTASEAKAVAGSGLLLPHLKPLQELSNEMGTLAQQYVAANDLAAAEEIVRLGRNLGRQLSAGEGPRYVIDELVGLTIERNLLSKMPPEAQPSFLQTNARDAIAQIDGERDYLRTLGPVFDQLLAQAPENDVISFFDRMKLQGERAALDWLEQRQGRR